MAEGPGSARRNPSLAWRIAKQVYRRSIRFRSRIPLMHSLFTEKEQMLNLAMQFVRANRVSGDYLEFGSYEGNSFIAAYHFAQAQGLGKMRFYSFDSFSGLPVSEGIDRDPEEATQYYPGDFACDVRAFSENLRSSRVSLEKVHLIEGFYRDSLTRELKDKLPIRAAAVLMVDCDLYDSARQVLEFSGDYLGHGSVVIFDDWYNFKGAATSSRASAKTTTAVVTFTNTSTAQRKPIVNSASAGATDRTLVNGGRASAARTMPAIAKSKALFMLLYASVRSPMTYRKRPPMKRNGTRSVGLAAPVDSAGNRRPSHRPHPRAKTTTASVVTIRG